MINNLLSEILSYPDESCINIISLDVCLDNGMCEGTISCPKCGTVLMDFKERNFDMEWPDGGGYVTATKVNHPLYDNSTKILKCNKCRFKMKIEFGSYSA